MERRLWDTELFLKSEVMMYAKHSQRMLTMLSCKIAIGCEETQSMRFLVNRVKKFQQKNPLVRFHIYNTSVDNIKVHIKHRSNTCGKLHGRCQIPIDNFSATHTTKGVVKEQAQGPN